MAVGDTAFCEVVRGKFDVNTVAHQDANAVSAHAARDGRENDVVAVVDLDLKISVRLFVDDYPAEGN